MCAPSVGVALLSLSFLALFHVVSHSILTAIVIPSNHLARGMSPFPASSFMRSVCQCLSLALPFFSSLSRSSTSAAPSSICCLSVFHKFLLIGGGPSCLSRHTALHLSPYPFVSCVSLYLSVSQSLPIYVSIHLCLCPSLSLSTGSVSSLLVFSCAQSSVVVAHSCSLAAPVAFNISHSHISTHRALLTSLCQAAHLKGKEKDHSSSEAQMAFKRIYPFSLHILSFLSPSFLSSLPLFFLRVCAQHSSVFSVLLPLLLSAPSALSTSTQPHTTRATLAFEQL